MRDDETRLTFAQRVREDARHEWSDLRQRVTYSRHLRNLKRGTVWAVEGWLLAWMVDAEPCSDYEARLLAEDEEGDVLVPSTPRNGMPWWEGYWRWWKPTHWPVYLRSLRRRTYVMVERGYDDE